MLNPISLAFKKAKLEKRAALLTYTVAGDSSKTVVRFKQVRIERLKMELK